MTATISKSETVQSDRAEWLEARRQGIGGSDAAAVMGLSPYKSAYELWLEKRGELQEEDLSDNEAVHFGTVLEDVVATEYARRTGRKVSRVNCILQHPEHPYMLANLDRRVVGERRILECKTADRFTLPMWGEAGTDQVPDHYHLQVTHYMAVTGAEVADLAVLIGGNEFRIYTIERDQELIDMVYDQEAEFWRMVQDGGPPDVDGSAATSALLKRLYPSSTGARIDLPGDGGAWVEKLREAKQDVEWATSRLDEAKHRIQVLAGEASEIFVGDRLVATWRQSKDRSAFDQAAFKSAHPDLFKQFSAARPGPRTFLIKKGK